MINGDINEFLEELYSGEEFELSYKNKQYFVESYYFSWDLKTHEIVVKQTEPNIENNILLKCKSDNPQHNVEEFLNAKIFEGKSFHEVEQEITWLDS